MVFNYGSDDFQCQSLCILALNLRIIFVLPQTTDYGEIQNKSDTSPHMQIATYIWFSRSAIQPTWQTRCLNASQN